MPNTKLGRYQVVEPSSSLMAMYFHTGGPLHEVDHEPHVAVLDQEDLLEQGIHTSQIVPGATDVDALGSCVFNAATAALSNVLDEPTFDKLTGATAFTDTTGAERFAIKLYHETTDLTGDPSTEWPPTDCGSSGLYVYKELSQLGVVHHERVANGAINIAALMQTDGLLVGQPWFNSWFEPDANGFIDGDGSPDALKAAIRSGVAGGHETYWSAIEHLTLTATGAVDAQNTVIRFRNSWSPKWADHGSARIHLSTYTMLSNKCDFRQISV